MAESTDHKCKLQLIDVFGLTSFLAIVQLYMTVYASTHIVSQITEYGGAYVQN